MVYIGIDLGTTYSCVAVVENGQPEAIHSDYGGKNIVPSVVAYNGNEILVGNPALDCNTDMANILYDSKRLIGWKFLNDLPIAEDRQLWTFNVDTRSNSAGYVLNKGKPNEKFLKPEEVSAEILKNLKVYAEKYLSKKVDGCVVTVPAIFTEQQLAATKRAVEMAGLNLIELLHEPTAAAIAYNQNNKLGNSIVLLFDWGGGTLDVTIAEMKNDQVSIKAVSGEPHLGGQDFDGRIMKYVIDNFKVSSHFDIYSKPKFVKRLRNECRKTKEALSTHKGPLNIHLDIRDDLELNAELTREKFNELCEELFAKTQMCVDRALGTAQLSVTDIKYVILVGGSSRIPFIHDKLSEKFGKSKLKFDINPDEAVALGAAIYASSTPILFYMRYGEYPNYEGKIYLFNSITFEAEIVEKFSTWAYPCEVAIGNYQIFLIRESNKVFKIFNYETKQSTRGPDPPEWRVGGTVAYYKNKLYYIGGKYSNHRPSSCVNILVNETWQRGPDFPIEVSFTRHSICNDKLYIICDNEIFQLSNDEREWIEVGKIEKYRWNPSVVSLNGKIYITGGYDGDEVLNSCLCFDPSQPFDRRFTSIANMNYKREDHSLIVANGKLYAIGGFQIQGIKNFCKTVEEYDPTTDSWQIVKEIE